MTYLLYINMYIMRVFFNFDICFYFHIILFEVCAGDSAFIFFICIKLL